MRHFVINHPLVITLKSLTGNTRSCVYTEPLWGIPYNLYSPYISVYMLSFGLADSQIGLIISFGFAFQILAALISGAVTDKMGRKRATFIFDTLSWSIPTLLWAIAQDFNYFLVAALFNSLWRVPMTSWTCLLVEDTDPKLLVDVYSWIYISGQIATFFAPLASPLINNYGLQPTMRGLYFLAFVLMTAKFIILNIFVDETKQGKIRMEETRNQSLLSLLKGYNIVFKQIITQPQTLYTLGIMLVMSICNMINNTFWSIIVTKKLLIPAGDLALYPFVRSSIMLLFFFLIMPRLRDMHFRNPMLIGFAGFVIGQLVLINAPVQGYLILLVEVVIEACSQALVATFLDKMQVINVNAQERARILSILYVIMISLTSPFGWIAGNLSQLEKSFPFMLNITLYIAGGLLVYFATKLKKANSY